MFSFLFLHLFFFFKFQNNTINYGTSGHLVSTLVHNTNPSLQAGRAVQLSILLVAHQREVRVRRRLIIQMPVHSTRASRQFDAARVLAHEIR